MTRGRGKNHHRATLYLQLQGIIAIANAQDVFQSGPWDERLGSILLGEIAGVATSSTQQLVVGNNFRADGDGLFLGVYIGDAGTHLHIDPQRVEVLLATKHGALGSDRAFAELRAIVGQVVLLRDHGQVAIEAQLAQFLSSSKASGTGTNDDEVSVAIALSGAKLGRHLNTLALLGDFHDDVITNNAALVGGQSVPNRAILNLSIGHVEGSSMPRAIASTRHCYKWQQQETTLRLYTCYCRMVATHTHQTTRSPFSTPLARGAL